VISSFQDDDNGGVGNVAVAAMPRGQRDQDGHRMVKVLKENVQTPAPGKLPGSTAARDVCRYGVRHGGTVEIHPGGALGP
jgi:hypothetical protein